MTGQGTRRPAALDVSEMSPNLRLNELVAQRLRAGRPTLHLGFGEARLPVVPELARVLADAAPETAYPPVAGTEPARYAAAGWFGRRRIPTNAGQVVLGPGTKPLLFATIAAVGGDVYVPVPGWNSYAPQVLLAGHHPLPVSIGPHCGGLPDVRLLQRRIDADRVAGRRPAAVILNAPDNPTGTTASAAVVHELCRIAIREGLTVISDEIYRDLLHIEGFDAEPSFLSPVEVLPERTVVLTGLSKSLAVGGWRIGVARFPGGTYGAALQARVVALASDVWSAMAAPMQAVAAYAFAEPPPVVARLRASARMHASIARACHAICRSRGAAARRPSGGFYVYADFEGCRDVLATHGAIDSTSLADLLLRRFDIAVLAGHHLGDDPERLTFKIATTGFIGDTAEEQFEALGSPDAAQLSHVHRRLQWLDAGLAAVTRPATEGMTD